MEPSVPMSVKAAEVTDVAAKEAVKVAGGLMVDLFGPSAKVMGQHWAARLQERNLAVLLRKTQARAKGDDPGIANTRVAAHAFEAVSYANDEVVAEYLSGVLASSRSESGSDDTGLPWSSLIARLSSDQLRLHYFIYGSARQALIREAAAESADANSLNGTDVLVPLEPAYALCDAVFSRMTDAVDGLVREGLLAGSYSWGQQEHLLNATPHYGDVLDLPWEQAMRVGVTVHGMRLFLWGLGHGDKHTDAYVDASVDLSASEDGDDVAPLAEGLLYRDCWSGKDAGKWRPGPL